MIKADFQIVLRKICPTVTEKASVSLSSSCCPGTLSDGIEKRQKIGLIHRKTHLSDNRSFDTIKLYTVCLSTTVVSADAEPGCNGVRFCAGSAESLWVDRPIYNENL